MFLTVPYTRCPITIVPLYDLIPMVRAVKHVPSGNDSPGGPFDNITLVCTCDNGQHFHHCSNQGTHCPTYTLGVNSCGIWPHVIWVAKRYHCDTRLRRFASDLKKAATMLDQLIGAIMSFPKDSNRSHKRLH